MDQEYLGSYRILKKIGAGGMAKVYLAVHQDVPNLKVILKILDDPRLGQRFRQEADKLALLDGHPNICRIKHFFSHGDDTVIAMEYIDGVTLEDKLKTDGRFTADETLRIVSEVLDILGFAHNKGIYHRDIKPGNIMLNKEGRVKIIDFGIAKGKTDPNLTVAGTACGTPAFMAPEQFAPTADTNYALVDIYAAGTTAFVMLTGEAPFKGDNPFIIRDAKLTTEPPGARSVCSEVPRELDKIILKSLARETADRYQTASEMKAAIDALRPGVPGERPVSPVDVTMDTPIPRLRKSRSRWWIGAGVLAAALAVFAVSQLITPDGPDDVPTADGTMRAVGDTMAGDAGLPATGTITVVATPSGDVYVDDSLVGRMLDSVSVTCDTGRHIVMVQNENASRPLLADTIMVAADQVVPLSFRFRFPADDDAGATTQTPPKPEPEFGYVTVGSSPKGADVYIDNVKKKGTTNRRFKVTPGRHVVRVELTLQGRLLTQQDTVTITRNGNVKVSFDLGK